MSAADPRVVASTASIAVDYAWRPVRLTSSTHLPPFVRFRMADLHALDRDESGAITAKDIVGDVHITGFDGHGMRVDFVVTKDVNDVGRAARLFALAKKTAANDGSVDIPASLLKETAPERALLAADSYAPFLRTTKIPDVLDALLAHPDPKLGVLGEGIAGRKYGVVGESGALESRTATYDGKKAYLYVPAGDPNAAALVKAAKSDPKYRDVAIVVVTQEQLASREERLAMRFDRPGMFYVSSRCPVLPAFHDDAYVVPGGRFGMELYYHDARINAPSMHATVERAKASGDVDGADKALSALRGTANALVNEVLSYGKIFNASMTTSAGRSQAPCLTTVIKETYAAWTSLHPEQKADAQKWLAWAKDAAQKELETVWMAAPRYDEKTGLSRYVDETPSVAPEEAEHFYQGMTWDADDIRSDAAVREQGWDSMPAALLTEGKDKGKPRMHELLPVCLQSLLFKYEKDLASFAKELGEPASSSTKWEQAAAKRKDAMLSLMWSPSKGVFRDLVQPSDHPTSKPRQNGAQDLRSLMPLWAGIVDDDAVKERAMIAGVREYLRPGGLSTSTSANWAKLFKLNPDYTSRCQWGHKDVGWPIATTETVDGLRRARASGASDLADEIAYRWCHAVQKEMDTHGGVHPDPRGGFTAPVFEKMNVTSLSHAGGAEMGYGNQGAGNEGQGGGFRWGLDAYKLLYRGLPESLQKSLQTGASPDAVFDARLAARA